MSISKLKYLTKHITQTQQDITKCRYEALSISIYNKTLYIIGIVLILEEICNYEYCSNKCSLRTRLNILRDEADFTERGSWFQYFGPL